MRQTVVAMFDRYAAAKQAAHQLRESGFGDSVYLTDEVGATEALDDGARTERDTGVFAQVRQFFSGIFGDDDRESSPYAEALRRGGAIVKVEVDAEADVERAREALEAAGAVDIDERASEWRASGWNEGTSLTREQPSLGEDRAASMAPQTGTTDASATTGAATVGSGSTTGAAAMGSESTTRGTTPATEGTEVIPVVKEELQVGKRAVRKGGVRVFARTVETPVRESVTLHSERAEVERRRVDRPATTEDLNDAGDRTIEVRETAEVPVVAKEARVVEEVSVGKRSEERTEEITDTVRGTEVEVENLPGDNAAGPTPYRTHFDANYARSGGDWDEYEPAYHYGEAARSRYQGRQWDEIEPELRGDWESSEPGTWEKFKAAIRHAWDRATS